MSRSPETPAEGRDTEVRDRRDDPKVVHDRPVESQQVSAAMPSVATVCGVLGLLAGIVSLVGILQLLSGLVGVVLGVAGVVLGTLAWMQARRNPLVTNGTAIAGTVFSIGALVLSGISMALIGGELQDLDSAVTQLQEEAEDVGSQVEEGADDAADEVTD